MRNSVPVTRIQLPAPARTSSGAVRVDHVTVEIRAPTRCDRRRMTQIPGGATRASRSPQRAAK